MALGSTNAPGISGRDAAEAKKLASAANENANAAKTAAENAVTQAGAAKTAAENAAAAAASRRSIKPIGCKKPMNLGKPLIDFSRKGPSFF